MPDMVFRILVTVAVSFFLSPFHLIGLQAYERYCYFISPLTYTRKFTKLHIYTAVIIVFVLVFSISLAVELITPKIAVATLLTYQATGLSSKISNYFYFFVYITPSGTMGVITLIRLRLLISKHKAQVQPAVSIDMNEDQSAVSL